MNGRYVGGRAMTAADRRTTGRGAIPARIVVTIMGVGLIAGACTSAGEVSKSIGQSGGTTSTSATSSSTTALAPTTTSLDPTNAAIVAAYRGMWADSDAVIRHYPINALDHSLEDHLAGNELHQIQSFLTNLRVQGEYAIGPPTDTSRAIVKERLGSTAVVADCDFDQSVIVNGRTNQVVKEATTQRALVNAKVDFVDGVWKVTEFSNVSIGCITAS